MSLLSSPLSRGMLACATTLAMAQTTWADNSPSKTDIEALFQQDRAACMDSASMHERSSCLREAGAVRAEALKGMRPAAPDPDQLQANAVQRCQRLPDEDKALCERRIQGEGNIKGSVEAGGLLRELVIELPARPKPNDPA